MSSLMLDPFFVERESVCVSLSLSEVCKKKRARSKKASHYVTQKEGVVSCRTLNPNMNDI